MQTVIRFTPVDGARPDGLGPCIAAVHANDGRAGAAIITRRLGGFTWAISGDVQYEPVVVGIRAVFYGDVERAANAAAAKLVALLGGQKRPVVVIEWNDPAPDTEEFVELDGTGSVATHAHVRLDQIIARVDDLAVHVRNLDELFLLCAEVLITEVDIHPDSPSARRQRFGRRPAPRDPGRKGQ